MKLSISMKRYPNLKRRYLNSNRNKTGRSISYKSWRISRSCWTSRSHPINKRSLSLKTLFNLWKSRFKTDIWRTSSKKCQRTSKSSKFITTTIWKIKSWSIIWQSQPLTKWVSLWVETKMWSQSSSSCKTSPIALSHIGRKWRPQSFTLTKKYKSISCSLKNGKM